MEIKIVLKQPEGKEISLGKVNAESVQELAQSLKDGGGVICIHAKNGKVSIPVSNIAYLVEGEDDDTQ